MDDLDRQLKIGTMRCCSQMNCPFFAALNFADLDSMARDSELSEAILDPERWPSG
jgi:hypothetical protein